jgi:uncharacterized protein YlxP (DUF503 family)
MAGPTAVFRNIAGGTGLSRRGALLYCIPMIVSMIQIIFEIPGVDSIKEKRRILRSMKDKLQRRFNMSVAEVDLQDSLSFAQVGGALVSNSRSFGESVLHKAFEMIERDIPVRIQDVGIHSEEF